MKTPDYAYLPKGSPYPTVVFEVGWTEDPNDLFSDAEQWLVKTSGQVQLVISIRFIENNSPLAQRRAELKRLITEPAPELEGRMRVLEDLIVQIGDNPGSGGDVREYRRAREELSKCRGLQEEWREYRRPIAIGGECPVAREEGGWNC